jgi:hypothetical protein
MLQLVGVWISKPRSANPSELSPPGYCPRTSRSLGFYQLIETSKLPVTAKVPSIDMLQAVHISRRPRTLVKASLTAPCNAWAPGDGSLPSGKWKWLAPLFAQIVFLHASGFFCFRGLWKVELKGLVVATPFVVQVGVIENENVADCSYSRLSYSLSKRRSRRQGLGSWCSQEKDWCYQN